MKRFFSMLAVLTLSAFTCILPSTAAASAAVQPVKAKRHHSPRHHAHKAAKHRQPRHPRAV